jgi:hypothetical protein
VTLAFTQSDFKCLRVCGLYSFFHTLTDIVDMTMHSIVTNFKSTTKAVIPPQNGFGKSFVIMQHFFPALKVVRRYLTLVL